MTRCRCAVDGCSNTSYENQTLKFFRMPRDPVTAMRWMKLIGRKDAKMVSNQYVCEEHFSVDCFHSNIKKLTKEALPCVNLPSNSMSTAVMVHKSTQYDLATKTNKKRETTYVTPTSSKNPRETFQELCDKYLSQEISQIVKAQADVRLNFNDKYDNYYRCFCLKLYYTSPASYLALQTSLNLPHTKTLARQFLSSIVNNHTNVFSTLEAKVSCMSNLEKNCSILIGFLDVKPHLFYHIKEDKIYGFSESKWIQNPRPADTALVLYARGIYEPWVLPIDYSLLPRGDSDSDTHRHMVSSWIHHNIKELPSIGLNIRVCISNLSHEIIAAAAGPQSAPINIEKPYFVIGKKRIYYMTDPTYTIKKIHSCFMEYEFNFRNAVAKWQDIVEFYNHDCKKILRLAPKLSEEYVKCSNGREVPYPHVVNTLNETVAAGISAYIEFGVMKVAAWGTVHFLQIISKLIDFTHSCNGIHHREFKRPFKGTEEQTNFIVEALTYFRDLRLYKNNEDVTDSVDFITDIQIAIKSLLMLSEDLTLENYPNLFTRNINFNLISNFFHSVSKRNRKSGELLPWNLVAEFRSRFLSNILRTPKYRYCPEVSNGIFFEYLNSALTVNPEGQNIRRVIPNKTTSFKAGSVSLAVFKSDYKNLNLPLKNQINAIGVFVLTKSLKMHINCTLPGGQRILDNDDSSLVDRYPQYRFDPVTKTVIPDKYFMLFMYELENELKTYLSSNFHNSSFLRKLETSAKSTADSFKPPCYCFPTSYVMRLFFRLRMAEILKRNNRTYHKESKEIVFSYKSLN